MNFKYVEEVAYSVDVEDIDYYFRTDNSSTPSQGVVHHNNKAIAGCDCWHKNNPAYSCFCDNPCIYAPGECPDDQSDFIDCCSSQPVCYQGSYSSGPCSDGGKE